MMSYRENYKLQNAGKKNKSFDFLKIEQCEFKSPNVILFWN